MANNCFYQMRAVAKNKEALERLVQIMQHKDSEYFIYRCFEAEANIYKDGDFYVADISGDMAWSCSKWFETQENKNELIVLDYDFKDSTVYGTAHYISIDLLCKILGIGVELFSEESGCQFQEHYLVNANGDFIFSEVTDWTQEWYDENWELLAEPIETGGFEYYGDFSFPNEIYGLQLPNWTSVSQMSVTLNDFQAEV